MKESFHKLIAISIAIVVISLSSSAQQSSPPSRRFPIYHRPDDDKQQDRTSQINTKASSLPQKTARRHEAIWNLQDEKGRRVPPAVYFLRMQVGSYSETKKLIVIR